MQAAQPQAAQWVLTLSNKLTVQPHSLHAGYVSGARWTIVSEATITCTRYVLWLRKTGRKRTKPWQGAITKLRTGRSDNGPLHDSLPTQRAQRRRSGEPKAKTVSQTRHRPFG